MGATTVISERLKSTDKLLSETLAETRELIKEAKSIHDNATSRIKILSQKSVLSDKEKQEYAELKTVRAEAEKAYYMMINILAAHE